MHSCISHALLAEMDWNGCIKTTMSNGSQSMGYACLIFINICLSYFYSSFDSYRGAEGGSILTRNKLFSFYKALVKRANCQRKMQNPSRLTSCPALLSPVRILMTKIYTQRAVVSASGQVEQDEHGNVKDKKKD